MIKKPSNFEDKQARKKGITIEVEHGDGTIFVEVEVVCKKIKNVGTCGQVVAISRELAEKLAALGKVKIVNKED